MTFSSWHKSEKMIKGGDNFKVEIVRWGGYNNTNNWNVYCYIYPEHPYFDKVCNKETDFLYFHRGISFREVHRDNNNNITSIQLGSDYQHMFDEFSSINNFEEATDIVRDAEKLYNQLNV